jgi:hypothetical protein
MRRHLLLGVVLATVFAVVGPAPATASTSGSAESAGVARQGLRREPPSPNQLLREARQATRGFGDVAAAEAAGYVVASECVEDPALGGMGVHYLHPGLVADGVIDHRKPELLVYYPTPGGGLRLGALEYFQVDADQDLATDGDRPSAFGVPFDGPMPGHSPDMPIHYDLHVWLFKHNPDGLFAPWNPCVHCQPAAG